MPGPVPGRTGRSGQAGQISPSCRGRFLPGGTYPLLATKLICIFFNALYPCATGTLLATPPDGCMGYRGPSHKGSQGTAWTRFFRSCHRPKAPVALAERLRPMLPGMARLPPFWRARPRPSLRFRPSRPGRMAGMFSAPRQRPIPVRLLPPWHKHLPCPVLRPALNLQRVTLLRPHPCRPPPPRERLPALNRPPQRPRRQLAAVADLPGMDRPRMRRMAGTRALRHHRRFQHPSPGSPVPAQTHPARPDRLSLRQTMARQLRWPKALTRAL